MSDGTNPSVYAQYTGNSQPMSQNTLQSMFAQALQAAGQSSSPQNIQALMNIAQAESSDRPDAINTYDSNAVAGHPSQGLMQVIPANFTKYGIGGNIMNPYDNTVAAINYMVARYGSVANALAYRQAHGNY